MPDVKTPVLAADAGGTQIRTALVFPDGTISARRSVPTPPASLADALIAALKATAQDGPAPWVISLSVPGPVDLATGAIETSANLTGPGTPIAEPLRREFGVPVFLHRDTVVAGLGEAAFGAAKGYQDFAYVTVSTGIGAAIFRNGSFDGGVHGMAGEIGHGVVVLDGPQCGCGQHGCLEAIASGTGILREYQRHRTTGAPNLATAKQVIEASHPQAKAVVDRAVHAFAAGMVSLVNAFDPGLVVVGGGVMTGLGQVLLAEARRAVSQHAYGAAARQTRFTQALLGDEAGLLGALPLIRNSTPVNPAG